MSIERVHPTIASHNFNSSKHDINIQQILSFQKKKKKFNKFLVHGLTFSKFPIFLTFKQIPTIWTIDSGVKRPINSICYLVNRVSVH